MKCLNKDPAIRPVSVRALAQVIAPEVITQPLFLTPLLLPRALLLLIQGNVAHEVVFQRNSIL